MQQLFLNLLVYFIDSSSVSLSLLIEFIRDGLKYTPKVVMTIDTSIDRIKDWEKILPAFSKLFSPILFAINDVVPILKPTPSAIIIK